MTWTQVERNRSRRLVAGVCSGIAVRTGIDVGHIRFTALLLTVAGGLGLVLYLVAWAVLPMRSAEEMDPPPPTTADPVDQIAVVVVAIGLTLISRALGLWFSDEVAAVGTSLAIGIALVWGRADDFKDLGGRRPLRIAIGVTLVAAGVVALLAFSGDLTTASWALLAALMAAAGAALLFGAHLARLSGERDVERRARIRVEERAEIAAHLHDGVLQTLTLIQKSTEDPKRVAQLARRQERELRQWLHGAVRSAEGTLATALADEIAAVEDDHGTSVELVCVGDCPLFEGTAALIAAVREAVVNAARHSGAARVDVYVEIEDGQVSAFVRDRGVGFDPAAIPKGRRGVRESIVGRMERAGGTAEIRTTAGDGTEVRLSLPHPEDGGPSGNGAGW